MLSADVSFPRGLSVPETKPDLDSGPTVIVPPAAYMAKTAPGSMATPRNCLEPVDSAAIKAQPKAPNYAFAFDIDGVLIRGGEVIPEAVEALRILNGENEQGIKVPYIFVTNGGGKPEEARCADLSRQLQVPVSPQQFICGHTPMREMAGTYNTVLVVGGVGEACRVVAEGYGFKDVVTPGDLMKSISSITPFRTLTEEELANSRYRDFSDVTIDAVFVFADSRHWGDDVQIIIDLLMSKNGRVGTRSETFDEGPPIFFSHNDVLWKTNHTQNRLGMGALRVMIEALFEQSTGKKLSRAVSFGKPQVGTFKYATSVLERWCKDHSGFGTSAETVYFVGDTPESDIKGTNEFDNLVDEEWYSILVKTGVYEAGTEPRHRPKATVNTVLDAVIFGMERSKIVMAPKLQEGSVSSTDEEEEEE
ncbi:HAD-superfamily hydrolase [Choiromyces venosus 120613-1]|uniref:HAD-superfamily hydrolase n=1 Tax=Choiromyces venosus 120613-1 TaxID=1336337 RepID=A0A3N4J7P8_9PEZI|nr:HAD-superfamily hydrolase [Choiromyces venosus 120613-1]